MYQVSQLYIYPVKSLGGIRINKCSLSDRGFENDRRWMLVDENNVFLSQRKTSEMCFFDLTENENSFTIRHRQSNQSIDLSKQKSEGNELQVQVWNDNVKAKLAGQQFDEYFSSHLHMNCRLVEMPENTKRLVDQNYAFNSEIVSFADAFPVLIIGEASLALLNSKLNLTVEMIRFRPNIVVSGGAAHDEDYFEVVSIGDAKLKNVKPCGRCVLPTIDFTTGEFQKEINTVLATYRTVNGKIMFGINCLIEKAGMISIGDTIVLHN